MTFPYVKIEVLPCKVCQFKAIIPTPSKAKKLSDFISHCPCGTRANFIFPIPLQQNIPLSLLQKPTAFLASLTSSTSIPKFFIIF